MEKVILEAYEKFSFRCPTLGNCIFSVLTCTEKESKLFGKIFYFSEGTRKVFGVVELPKYLMSEKNIMEFIHYITFEGSESERKSDFEFLGTIPDSNGKFFLPKRSNHKEGKIEVFWYDVPETNFKDYVLCDVSLL